jgi:thiol reductant ABC exporter CydD subunit
MSAVDRRLRDEARTAGASLWPAVALGVVGGGLAVAQAWYLAEAVAVTVAPPSGAGTGAVTGALVAVLAVVVARAAVAWLVETVAQRSSATVKSALRRRLLDRVVDLGPTWLASHGPSRVETLATRGLDALDPYVGRLLPQTVTAVVVPGVVTLAVATHDLVAAALMVGTLPLVVVFMAVVGAGTRARTARRLVAVQRLAGRFLDTVAGLATLKVFGAGAGDRPVRAAAEDLRRETMGTLRLAFLSSLVLELTASLSIALVAVAVGLRLVSGDLDLRTGLFVLVLAPEAYLPLRALASHFHAGADGKAAAEQVFAVLDTPVPGVAGHETPPDLAAPSDLTIRFEHVSVRFPGDPTPAVADLSFAVAPGEVVALVGPSGCGKSTALGVLLGLVPPTSGRVVVGDRDLAGLDRRRWLDQVAWLPQRPHLFAETLLWNVTMGRDVAPERVDAAVEAAGLRGLLSRLPAGLATTVGERAQDLSAGERQRVALARAFVTDAPLLVLDEPTAHLDGDTEQALMTSLATLTAGRTVVLAAHRHGLLALADRVVDVDLARVGSLS